MLSIYATEVRPAPVDGRYDETRWARADSRFPARFDARAVYVCRPRGVLESGEAAAPEYFARRGR